jgi:iron complex outermembrane receptor protein
MKGLLFQSAAFRIERDFFLINSQNIYGPDGRSRYQGVELSLNGSITRNWTIYTDALFLQAKQISGSLTTVTTTLSPDGSFYINPSTVGNRIENTAKRTFSLATNYDLSDWIEGVSVNGGVYYTGNQAINALNSNFIPAACKFEVSETPMTVRLNMENVGNKRYFISTGSNVVSQAPQGCQPA